MLHKDWEYPDPHFTQRSRKQSQSLSLWPAHTYQSNLHDALLSHCATLPLSGLTLGLNLLASHTRGAQQQGAGKDMKYNSACFSSLTLTIFTAPLSSPLFPEHILQIQSVSGPSAWLNCCMWYLASGARQTPCCRCLREPGWAVMGCSWELIMRGFHSDLCTLAVLAM